MRNRSKSILSKNCTYYICEPSSFKKIPDPLKNSTDVQYLTVLTSTMPAARNTKDTDLIPQLPENGEFHISNNNIQPASTNYERFIAHAAKVKFTNIRYTTLITVNFGSSISENSVNLPVKHHKIFIAIKLLDPSASITIKDKVITNPQEFPMGTEYTEYFVVITDKKTKLPRFFVYHDVHSTLTFSAMKYSDHNIMSTLQYLRTWQTLTSSQPTALPVSASSNTSV